MTKNHSRFVTFYSYKGGVGRTSALVNAAISRTLAGDKVVVIDFDLEAPGVGAYFKKLSPAYNPYSRGILEYLVEAINNDKIPSLVESATDLSANIHGKNGGELWTINAGNVRDPKYSNYLEQLKWNEIFEHHEGELLLSNLKNQIATEFGNPDYVFIDSRTGITEVGGVCTRYLADTVVLLTSLNEQNVQGTSEIYRQLVADNLETIVVASNVPVGMPLGENQLFTNRLNQFKDAFNKVPDLFIYHYPSLSVEEHIANLESIKGKNEKSVSGFDPLHQSYNFLADVINRKHKYSYSKALLDAASSLKRIELNLDEDLIRISILAEKYQDRLLAKIILGLSEAIKRCNASPENIENWQINETKELIDAGERTNNRAVRLAISATRDVFSKNIQKHLRKGHNMEEIFEVFLKDEDWLIETALDEISKNHYQWPIKFLESSLQNTQNTAYERAVTLFNLAHCYKVIGKEAKSLFKEFLEVFEKIKLDVYPIENQANYLFCLSIASLEVGDSQLSKSYLDSAESRLQSLGNESKIFSPIRYKRVPASAALEELKEFKIKNFPFS